MNADGEDADENDKADCKLAQTVSSRSQAPELVSCQEVAPDFYFIPDEENGHVQIHTQNPSMQRQSSQLCDLSQLANMHDEAEDKENTPLTNHHPVLQRFNTYAQTGLNNYQATYSPKIERTDKFYRGRASSSGQDNLKKFKTRCTSGGNEHSPLCGDRSIDKSWESGEFRPRLPSAGSRVLTGVFIEPRSIYSSSNMLNEKRDSLESAGGSSEASYKSSVSSSRGGALTNQTSIDEVAELIRNVGNDVEYGAGGLEEDRVGYDEKLYSRNDPKYSSNISNISSVGTNGPGFRLTSIGRESNVVNVDDLFYNLPPRTAGSPFCDDMSDIEETNEMDITLPRKDSVEFLVGSSASIENGLNVPGNNLESILSTFGSGASIISLGPICRICHQGATKEQPLISPCRCDGTLKYVHNACINKWLRVAKKRNKNYHITHKKPLACELCNYPISRHKHITWSHFRWPSMPLSDKIYHGIFLLSLIVMIVSATITIMVFHRQTGLRRSYYQQDASGNIIMRASLTAQEVVTLVCGISFFAGFFVAMYAELKAKKSWYTIFSKIRAKNSQWIVHEYVPAQDPERKCRYVRQTQAARNQSQPASKTHSFSTLPNIPEEAEMLVPGGKKVAMYISST